MIAETGRWIYKKLYPATGNTTRSEVDMIAGFCFSVTKIKTRILK